MLMMLAFLCEMWARDADDAGFQTQDVGLYHAVVPR